jgi:8-oxo-dGTP diphosphatase
MSSDRLYPSRPFLAASVAVFRDGKVLVASRGKPPWEDVFSLPGGRVEVGGLAPR